MQLPARHETYSKGIGVTGGGRLGECRRQGRQGGQRHYVWDAKGRPFGQQAVLPRSVGQRAWLSSH